MTAFALPYFIFPLVLSFGFSVHLLQVHSFLRPRLQIFYLPLTLVLLPLGTNCSSDMLHLPHLTHSIPSPSSILLINSKTPL